MGKIFGIAKKIGKLAKVVKKIHSIYNLSN